MLFAGIVSAALCAAAAVSAKATPEQCSKALNSMTHQPSTCATKYLHEVASKLNVTALTSANINATVGAFALQYSVDVAKLFDQSGVMIAEYDNGVNVNPVPLEYVTAFSQQAAIARNCIVTTISSTANCTVAPNVYASIPVQIPGGAVYLVTLEKLGANMRYICPEPFWKNTNFCEVDPGVPAYKALKQ